MKKLVTVLLVLTFVTFISILLAVVLVAGCAPKATGTVDVPVGDNVHDEEVWRQRK